MSIDRLTEGLKKGKFQMYKHRLMMGLLLGLVKVSTWALKGTWKLTIKLGKFFFKVERKDCGCP